MKIFELGLRTFLTQNGWECVGENSYEKGDRTINIVKEKEIHMFKEDIYLLTTDFNNFEIGLTRYFITS